MKLRALHSRQWVFWLGLLALVVSGIQQNSLSRDVLSAAVHTGSHGHIMPDGSFMAGDMGAEMASPKMASPKIVSPGHHHTDPAKNGGHSHKGHADCVLCGPVAAMASFTQAPPVVLVLPETRVVTAYRSAEQALVLPAYRTPYASRAPPARHA